MSGHFLPQAPLMPPNMPDPDEHEDDGEYNPPAVKELAGIEKSTVRHTGLTPRYAHDWTNRDAFRELYQNWKDGITKEFSLDQVVVKKNESEQENEIIYSGIHPKNQNLLGYIRFKWDKQQQGTLELTNFNSSLQLWHLALGGSKKQQDDMQIGEHGEGLKLAMLHFRRFPQNYPCRIESSSAHWTWSFNKDMELDCKVVKLEAQEVRRRISAVYSEPRTTESRIWSDVSVLVGGRGKKIPLREFHNMLTVTTDLEPPKDIHETNYGDLILDSSHASKLYLKGLLLGSLNFAGKPVLYSYNFKTGKTNRDREGISLSKIGRQVAKIWNEAVLTGEEEVVNTYTDLLLKQLNKVVDAMLPNHYVDLLSGGSVQRIWDRMGKINIDENGNLPFYFVSDSDSDDAHVIRFHLNRNPIPIDRTLWNILTPWVNCRTAVEEQEHLFEQAQRVSVRATLFAHHIDWCLRCLIQSHPATRAIEYTFVMGDGLGLDMVFSGSQWSIDDKWQDFNRAHAHSYHAGCENTEPTANHPFSCDHVAEWLWDSGISYAVAANPHSEIALHESMLKGLSRFKLRQMPRNISCTQTDRLGELSIRWESIDSFQDRKKPMIIYLHYLGCSNSSSEQSHDDPRDFTSNDPDTVTCGCPYKEVDGDAGAIVFEGLDPGKYYYPKVSRTTAGAFFGIAPGPVQPRSEDREIILDFDHKVLQQAPAATTIPSSVKNPGPPSVIPQRATTRVDSTSPTGGPIIPESHRGIDDARHTQRESTHCSKCGGGGGCLYDHHKCSRNRDSNASSSSSSSHTVRAPGNSQLPESYAVGDPIEKTDLGWAGWLLRGHNFFHASNRPEDNVVIAKPKTKPPRSKRGRPSSQDTAGNSSKKASYA